MTQQERFRFWNEYLVALSKLPIKELTYNSMVGINLGRGTTSPQGVLYAALSGEIPTKALEAEQMRVLMRARYQASDGEIRDLLHFLSQGAALGPGSGDKTPEGCHLRYEAVLELAEEQALAAAEEALAADEQAEAATSEVAAVAGVAYTIYMGEAK